MPNTQTIRLLDQLRLSILNLDNANDTNIADERVNVIEALHQLGVDNINELINAKETSTDNLGEPVERLSIEVPDTQSARQKANNKAVELLDRIKAEGLTRDDLSRDEIETLAKYTGNGGGLVDRNGRRGSQYEYYTPKEIAAGMWDLAQELGFNGGKVLDPSSGTGVFTATSPASAVIDSIELDEISGGIAKVLNDGSRSHTVISPFEAEAKRIPDNSLDMVITNVPFGDNSARGDNKFKDNAYQKDTLETYFILRSLEKIKAGGLAIFITPDNIVSGKRANKERLRQKTSLKAEFLGGYRLPNIVFSPTGADVVTDVVVYRKHSDDAIEKINDLYKAGDTQTLKDAGVLWDSYISGQYFKNEGKRYILGEVEVVKNRYGGNSERVVSQDLTPDIAKKLKKFDNDSRINWDMIDSAEPAIIDYQNGDTIFQNGKQLQYKDGVWLEVEREVTDTEREIQDLLAKIDDSNSIIANNVSYDDIERIIQYAVDTGQRGLIPYSVEQLIDKTLQSGRSNLNAIWECVVVADAIDNLFNEHGYSGYDYYNNHKKITERIKDTYISAKGVKLTGDAKHAFKVVAMHYNKGKYSEAWRGEINNEVEVSQNTENYQSKMARYQYENKSLYLSLDQLKDVHPEVEPLNDDDWFVSADGQSVIHANDFLVGTLAERLKDIDEQIAKATDDKIKSKLIRQKTVARQSVIKTDFNKLQYDLRSPLIDAETKVRFLKQFVSIHAVVVYDEYGKGTPDIQINTSSDSSSDLDKMRNRIGDWLAKGTVTLGGIKLDNYSDREALEWISKEINKANENFNSWIKADPNLIAELDAKNNADEHLFFSQNADDSPIDIAGMNPDLSLHGYQNEFVRKQGRFFGGINGMGVGLGKTFSALASVQHVQNIGAKKKTLFVVPNSVLSNWRKEAQFAYENTDDCIFVGLREKGDEFRVYSNKYDEDLLKAIDGKYRKVFLTYEAFRRIRLKDETIGDYAQYLKDTDSAYENKDLNKDDEKAKGLVGELIENIKIKSSAPYLEDMNVDSVVIDEAHAFKNSITAPKTNAQVKYLSLPQTSTRGEDAQAKLFYVRGRTKDNDGVQLLSATPITNSPLEVYSMLSLAAGRKAVNSMAAGVKGADEFLQLMCDIQEEVLPTIDGGERAQNVFTGIRNVQVLRKAIQSTSTIKDAKQVGMSVVIPERDEQATKVELSTDTKQLLETYQKAYKIAREMTKDNPDLPLPQDPEHPDNPNSSYQQVKRIFNEPDKLMGHPFNLINKMDILIADDDFSKQATFYDFNEDDKALAEKVVAEFNKKPKTDERDRLSVFTDEKDAKAIYTKDGDEKVLSGYKIKVKSKIVLDKGRERIVIDTLNAKQQDRFEKIADKNKLELKVTASTKVAAMIENFKQEMANPRGSRSDGSTSGVVKQIIFCDHLFLHNKIKRLLVERAGVKADKIAIITGQTNNEPDEMIDIQDGFNAMDDDNRYQVVIANQKAEVGINLQKGTQAIHHLTTGWTPDSLEQRNGRGARQGNMTDKVTIYHYDADGTFDEFKRTMINKKDEWISNVLSDDDSNTVAVSGGISQAEQEALIELGGDKDAIAKYQAQKEAKEAEARAQTARNRQLTNLETIQNQKEYMRNLSPITFLYDDILTVVEQVRANRTNLNKSQNKKSTEQTRETYAKKYEQNKKIAVDLLEKMLPTVVLYGNETTMTSGTIEYEEEPVKITAEQVYNNIEKNYKEFAPSKKGESARSYDSWERRFKDMLIEKKSGSYISRYELKDDTPYHDDYDTAKTAAEKLIEQAGNSIDEISKEYGGLPVGAGKMLAENKARLRNGHYYAAGYIVVNVENDDVIVGIVDEDLKIKYLVSDTESSSLGTVKERYYFSGGSDYKVFGPNDPEYIGLVKELAAIEDKIYSFNSLDTALYSNQIPQVAEYRRDDIEVKYKLEKTVSANHYEIINGPLPFVLPINVLNTGTEAANALLKAYENAGIEIDYEDNAFSISDNSKVEVSGKIIVYDDEDETGGKGLQEFIIDNNIELTEEDKQLLRYRGLTKTLLLRDKNLAKKINSYVDRRTKVDYDLSYSDIRDMPSEIYNRFLADNLYANSLLDHYRNNEDNIVGYFLNEEHKRINATTIIRDRNINYLKEMVSVPPDENNSSDELKDDDNVIVTGYTKTWKDEIKEYADQYGSKVRGNRKYFYNSKRRWWVISYKAFKKLTEDYPKAAQDLSAEKEV